MGDSVLAGQSTVLVFSVVLTREVAGADSFNSTTTTSTSSGGLDKIPL